MAKSFELKVTSAFVWGGKVRTAGSTITLAERDARRLLSKGKVEIVTESGDDDDARPARQRKAPAKGGGAAGKNLDGGGDGGGAPEA